MAAERGTGGLRVLLVRGTGAERESKLDRLGLESVMMLVLVVVWRGSARPLMMIGIRAAQCAYTNNRKCNLRQKK
jgi:hypothetical protein